MEFYMLNVYNFMTIYSFKTQHLVICHFLLHFSDATAPKEIISEPEFAEPIPNVTVSAGRDVSLPCVVDDLGTFRVSMPFVCLKSKILYV